MFRELILKLLPVSRTECFEKLLLKHYNMSKNLLANVKPDLIEKISEKKALAVFKKASKNIPAYRRFLRDNNIKRMKIKNIDDFNHILPPTTKENYVKKNRMIDLFMKGRLPKQGIIEESSGSSGTPTNWVKSASESDVLELEVEFESKYLFGKIKKPSIILSCWSPGPWATDLRFCEFFEHLGLIKNIGPNIEDVVDTINQFGSKHHYLIAGYPPFCKALIEKTKDRINWKKYDVDLLVGGEGFVLGWREHISSFLRKDAKIFSAYGCSDLDIGIAFETPLTIFIRGQMAGNNELRKIFCKSGMYPMIFQYNPLEHYISNIYEKVNEFAITPLNSSVAAPKVKYNIHDEGKKVSFSEMIGLLPQCCHAEICKSSTLHLPFLLVYGRSDGTLSINGTNIYPQQIELAIMKNKSLFSKLNTFRISKRTNKNNEKLLIKLELKKGINSSKKLNAEFKKTIIANMQLISGEYKQALKEFKESFEPEIFIYLYDSGPFEQINAVKNKYIE
jgi:phenylacetate-CoA ligase